jgi:SSS family solute:Na+ symporter
MVLPGVIGYVLFKDQIGADNDSTLMVMMTELLPVGIRGLMAAGLLAALMSTIEAALNSTATLTAEDIVKRIRPGTADHQLVTIGRATAAVVVVLAMLWSTQGAKFGSIFEAINKIPMAFAPGITTIFLWGVFWRRGNRQGAMAAMLFNVLVGLVYLAIDIPLIGEKQLIAKELGIPFMQVGWYLFLLSSAVYFVVSLATPAPAADQVKGLCWTRPLDALRGRMEGTITDPRVMAAILFLIMIVLYGTLS